jgi:hypothetical protein
MDDNTALTQEQKERLFLFKKCLRPRSVPITIDRQPPKDLAETDFGKLLDSCGIAAREERHTDDFAKLLYCITFLLGRWDISGHEQKVLDMIARGES